MYIVKIKHQNSDKEFLYETPVALRQNKEVLVENKFGIQHGVVAEDSIDARSTVVLYIVSSYHSIPLARVIGRITRF